MTDKRIYYLDVLKIISCIAVVIIHCTAVGFYEMNMHSIGWIFTVIFNLLSRFAVPVFVMVSGALFLNENKKCDIKKLYTKNILHLVIIYIIWTLIYSIYNVFNKQVDVTIINVIKDSVIKSYYHLWFIPMLIGLYVLIPVIKPITKDRRIVEYFLIIFTLLYVIPYTIGLFNFPYSEYIGKILSRIQLPMLSYLGYFVLGHYLHTYKFSNKIKKIIYVLGCFAIIISILGTVLYSFYIGQPKETLAREFSITTYMVSIAIFVFVKQLIDGKEIRFKKIIIHMSNASLGIYLIHALFRDILKNQLGFSFTTIWNLPVNFIVIIFLSYIISYGISKIPVINKYII